MSVVPETSRTPTAAPRAITARAVALGLLLVPPNILWIVRMERVDGRVFSTTASIFFTAVLTLFVLVAVNALLHRAAPRRAMSQGELLLIFSMVSIASAMAGVDFGSPLLTTMAHGFWFATPENHWQQLFWSHLPRWLTVSDRSALSGYYLGGSSLYRWVAIRAWLPPAACWTAFIVVLLWVMACINTMIRAQWTDKERLTYPVIQLPIAMTAPGGGLYRARLFWGGFALTAGLSLVNGLHFLYPQVPGLTFNGFDAQQWFPSAPWNAMGWTPLAIFPFIVGLGYLLPVDLLFSCWFFFLFWRFEKVAAAALGYSVGDHHTAPYIDEQAFGAYMAVFVFAIWSARSHLRAVWRAALSRDSVRDLREAMSFRTAVAGALIGLALLTAFGYYAGMPVWLAAAFFAIYFAIAVAVTRMRAELGPPTHDLHFIGPDQTLSSLIGTRNLSGDALGAFTLFYWFNRAYRCHPMPHQLEGLRMAQATGTSRSGWIGAMMVAALVGVACTFWFTLDVSYRLGAAARITGWSSLGYGTEAYDRLAGWMTNPKKPDVVTAAAMAVGFAIASMLSIARMSIYGWPFHALGFALSGGWSMSWSWLSLFVAWIAKSLVLRWSGLPGYRAGLPFFFGVILGDFVVGGAWTIIGIVFHVAIYSVWSG